MSCHRFRAQIGNSSSIRTAPVWISEDCFSDKDVAERIENRDMVLKARQDGSLIPGPGPVRTHLRRTFSFSFFLFLFLFFYFFFFFYILLCHLCFATCSREPDYAVRAERSPATGAALLPSRVAVAPIRKKLCAHHRAHTTLKSVRLLLASFRDEELLSLIHI